MRIKHPRRRDARMVVHRRDTANGTGDSLFLYTDGLNEAEDIDHQQFRMERSEQVAKTTVNTPQTLIEAMTSSVAQFVGNAEQSDDLTMLAIHYTLDTYTKLLNPQTQILNPQTSNLNNNDWILSSIILIWRASVITIGLWAVTFTIPYIGFSRKRYKGLFLGCPI